MVEAILKLFFVSIVLNILEKVNTRLNYKFYTEMHSVLKQERSYVLPWCNVILTIPVLLCVDKINKQLKHRLQDIKNKVMRFILSWVPDLKTVSMVAF